MTAAHIEPGAIFARRFGIVRTLQAALDGAVFLVRDLRGDAGTAVLKTAAGRDPSLPRTARVEREFRILSQLRGSIAPRALDFGRDPDADAVWLLTEYVPGPALGRRGVLAP